MMDSDTDVVIESALGVPIAAGVLYRRFGTRLGAIIASAAMTFSSVSGIANARRRQQAPV